MKILFWQNIISKHQKDLLEQMTKLGHEISVVIDRDIPAGRRSVGWNTVKYIDIDIYYAHEILKDSNIKRFITSFDFHIFSSIGSYKNLYRGFKLCEKYNCKIAVYSEDKDLRGLKGQLRKLDSKLEYYKHNKSISKIFAIGTKGVEYFLSIGFDKEKIEEFGYFVKPIQVNEFVENKTPKYLFVGNLNEQKGVRELISAFSNSNNHIDIFGDGPLKNIVKKNIFTVNYKGVIDNNELLSIINFYDYLILPSKYDGWGVVINEALIHGCNVITTNKTGASSIVKRFPKSTVIDSNNIEKDLIDLLNKNRPLTEVERIETIRIAKNQLHPKVGALKMIKVLEGVFKNE